MVRTQAGGRNEDEASTGAGGVSRAVRIVVRIVVRIQAGARRRATTGAGGVSRAVRTGVRIPVRIEAGSNVALRDIGATNSSHKQ